MNKLHFHFIFLAVLICGAARTISVECTTALLFEQTQKEEPDQ